MEQILKLARYEIERKFIKREFRNLQSIMILFVRVKPGASKEYIKEVQASEVVTPFHLLKKADRYFEAAVHAPREKGKANARLIELLAKHLGIASSRLNIVSGQTAREKMIEIH